MFDTFLLYPAFFRLSEIVLRAMRTSLIILGAIFAIGLLSLVSGYHLPDWSSPAVASQAPVTSESTPAENDEAPTATPVALSPRMQAALNYASRRYHVSAEALQPIFQVAQQAAQETRMDPLLIVAVIAIESKFNPLSESSMGAQGLMQIIPRFHLDKLPPDAGKLPFFDPEINVQVGARALHEFIRRSGGVVPGLQQFGGVLDDPANAYASKVLAERDRMEGAQRRKSPADA